MKTIMVLQLSLLHVLIKSDGIKGPIVLRTDTYDPLSYRPFYMQATDSVLWHMMHHSDNFFAEEGL